MQDEREEYRFFAFISYKRGGEDERHARWLQNRLEKYRIPTEITGIPPEELRARALPRRLSVFRDKTDLGSHASLDQGLSSSLEQCRYLIVIASPRSAASPYVADEVRFFMERGWQDRIIPFIIDGTPAPGDEERQCYPPTLPASVLGVTLAEGSREEALIKTIARLLQVDYPLLYQRHLRAQRRFMLRLLGGALCMLALVSGLALWALDAERRASAQRDEAEALVEFLTFDLREQAFDHIPARAREQIIRKVSDHYEKWGAGSFRARYSRAAHLVNRADLARQDEDARTAVELSTQSLSQIESLREGHPDNPDLALAMAGPLSILVRSAIQLGDVGRAGLYADKALGLAETLAEQKPDDPRRIRFLADSLELKRSALTLMGRYREKLAVAERAAAVARELAALDPADEKNRDLLAGNLGEYCLELAHSGAGDALPVCREAYGIAKQLAQGDPFNIQRTIMLLGAQDNLSSVLLERGQVEVQTTLLRERQTLLGNLIRLDPDRTLWQANLAGTLIMEAHTRLYMLHGSKDEALRLLDEAEKVLDLLLQKHPDDAQALRMRENLKQERKDAAAPLPLEEQQDKYLLQARENLVAYKSNPADMQQGETARRSFSLLADLYFQRGLHAPALHWYEQEKELLLELRRQVPDEPRFTVRLAASWTSIARARQSLGSLDLAAEAAGEAVALVEKAETSPPVPELHAIGCRAFLQAADTAERRGRFADALSLSVRAVERAEKAPESYRSNAARRELIFALLRAGVCAGSAGDYPRAETMLRKAAALGREAMRDTDMVRFERIPVLFVECLHTLADTLGSLGGTDEAAGLLDEAGAVLKAVPQPTGSADYREWQNSYVLSLTMANCSLRVRLELDRGNVKKAGDRTLEMLRIAAASKKTDRNVIALFVENGPVNIESLTANGHWADARAWQAKAQEIAGSGKRPESTSLARLQLARVLIQGAAIAVHDKDADAARERASRSLQILAPLAGRTGQSGTEVPFTLARSHAALGAALAASGDSAAALAQMDKALETLRALCVAEPRQIRWRTLLEQCLTDGAALCEKTGDADKAAALRAETTALRLGKARVAPAAP